MKIVKLPILRQGEVMLHLTRVPDYINANDATGNLLGILADLGDSAILDALVGMINNSVRKSGMSPPDHTVLQQIRLPDGEMLVAGAPETKAQLMEVRDAEHALYRHIGEIFYAEGETIYLWFPHLDKGVPFELNQLKLTKFGR